MQHKMRGKKRYSVGFWQLAIVTLLLMLVTGCSAQQAPQQTAGSAPEQQSTQQIANDAPKQPIGQTDGEAQQLTAEEALQLACDTAGVDRAAVKEFSADLDNESGRMVYEVDLVCGDVAYDYTLDAKTGELLSQKQESRQTSSVQTSDQQNGKSSGDDIGADKAKQIALQHAGVAEGDTQAMEVKREQEHGRLIYEVEFEVGHIDYEYEIDGASGEILKAETD